MGARTVEHYLYFSSNRAARRAASKLSKDGFLVEVRRSAQPGSGFLVRPSHVLEFNENAVLEVRRYLESVAKSFDGEYDGWEVAVSS